MKLLEMDGLFIAEHIDELVTIEDYVPVSFVQYDKHHERCDFLRSKNLLTTMRQMDELVRQKCNHADDSVEAYNSVLIEWLVCHPEFEGILTSESRVKFYDLKNTSNRFKFIDLLYDVQLPSEKKEWKSPGENISIRDDSTIQLPDFKEKDKIHDKYGLTLLSCYLSYLV